MSYSTTYHRFTNANSSRSLSTYLKELRRIPSLTTEDNMCLAQRIAEGDLKARDRMISGNLTIVLSVYKPYLDCGLQEEDLINAGNEGLIKAVDNFDYTRGVPFYIFARTYIEGAILDAINEEGSVVRVPRSAKESDDYLYYDLDESGELIERRSTPVRGIYSLSERTGNSEDSRTYEQILAQDEQSSADRVLMNSDRRTELEQILRTRYSKKDQQVIRMRLGLDGHPMQVWEIAEKMGNTTTNIYTILHKVCPAAS